jgi:hypothetical protein
MHGPDARRLIYRPEGAPEWGRAKRERGNLHVRFAKLLSAHCAALFDHQRGELLQSSPRFTRLPCIHQFLAIPT